MYLAKILLTEGHRVTILEDNKNDLDKLRKENKYNG